jgi:hypothetical protein
VAFTKDQPKDGDTILHCGHTDSNLHWFKFERPMKFERPNKTRGQTEWFVSCDACFIKYGENVTRFPRGDRTWTGDAPIVEESVKS